MAASCPAGECDFSGATEAVFGHIGGRSDPVHKKIGAPDLLGERGSEGPSFWFLVAVGAGIVLAVHLASEGVEPDESGSGDPGLFEEGEETTETKRLEGPSEGFQAGRVGVD